MILFLPLTTLSNPEVEQIKRLVGVDVLCLGWLLLLRGKTTRTEESFIALAPYNQGKANSDFRCELPQEDYPYTMTQVPKDLVTTWGCSWKVMSIVTAPQASQG